MKDNKQPISTTSNRQPTKVLLFASFLLWMVGCKKRSDAEPNLTESVKKEDSKSRENATELPDNLSPKGQKGGSTTLQSENIKNTASNQEEEATDIEDDEEESEKDKPLKNHASTTSSDEEESTDDNRDEENTITPSKEPTNNEKDRKRKKSLFSKILNHNSKEEETHTVKPSDSSEPKLDEESLQVEELLKKTSTITTKAKDAKNAFEKATKKVDKLQQELASTKANIEKCEAFKERRENEIKVLSERRKLIPEEKKQNKDKITQLKIKKQEKEIENIKKENKKLKAVDIDYYNTIYNYENYLKLYTYPDLKKHKKYYSSLEEKLQKANEKKQAAIKQLQMEQDRQEQQEKNLNEFRDNNK